MKHEPFDNSDLTEFKINSYLEEYSYLIESTIRHAFSNPESFLGYHGLDMDDAKQFGLIGLHKAIVNYNESKGTAFISYAITNIKGYLFSHIKRFSLYRQNSTSFDLIESVSLDYTGDTSEEESNFRDRVEATLSTNSEFEAAEAKILKDKLAEHLPEKALYIIDQRLKGYNNVEIAEKMGITRQAVEGYLRRNKQLVKEALTN